MHGPITLKFSAIDPLAGLFFFFGGGGGGGDLWLGVGSINILSYSKLTTSCNLKWYHQKDSSRVSCVHKTQEILRY